MKSRCRSASLSLLAALRRVQDENCDHYEDDHNEDVGGSRNPAILISR